MSGAVCLQFPTANRAMLEPGREDQFFVGTPGRSWTSGTFGCVRSDGWQMHEGVDIRCLERDRSGEPIDPVLAAADGIVAYTNPEAGLSNYGKYIILKHWIDSLEVYSTYAHLSEIQREVRIGAKVRAGQRIGTMGRTTNTRERISRDRAHLHFELALFVNERFPAWYKQALADQRNDHGVWNGQNLLGLDPRLVLLQQTEQGENFSLLEFVRNQTEMCRVLVRDTSFPWLRRYTMLIRRNSIADRDGVAGYEIALNYNGVPFQLVPRAASEMESGADKFHLLSVNEAEYGKNPCRKLVIKEEGQWKLGPGGIRLLELLTY